MALINCPECNKEVSDKAENCIHCGFPLNERHIQETFRENIFIVTNLKKSKTKRFNRWLLETSGDNNPNLTEGIFNKGDKVSLLDKDSMEIYKCNLDTYCYLKMGNGLFSFGFDNIDDLIIEKTESISISLPVGKNFIQNTNQNLAKCPRCGSTQIQAVPRKWSLMTGLLTNKVDRVCLNCKNKF